MLKRFIKTYPYITKPSTLPPILKNFPISFGSPPTTPLHCFNVHPTQDSFAGILQVFELFLSSVANNTLSNLEGALEHNFLQKLNSSVKDLSSHGYKLRLAGDIKNTKIFITRITNYSGAVLPFRNLMLPAEYYNVHSVGNGTDSVKGYLLNVRNNDIEFESSFEGFKDFDFEKENKEGLKSGFKRIEEFFQIGTEVLIDAQDHEFLVESEFRLMVLDANGKVVSGNEEDRVEVHSGVLEIFEDISGKKWFYKKALREAKEIYAKILDGYLNQNTLVDFDGFMGGNPPVPKSLIDKFNTY